MTPPADNPIIRAWAKADGDTRLEALQWLAECYGQNLLRIIQYSLNKADKKQSKENVNDR